MDSTDPLSERRRRLVDARMKAGFTSARAAALIHNWPESTYRAHETGGRNFSLEDALKYGAAFRVDGNWIFAGGAMSRRTANARLPLPNATVRREIVPGVGKRLNVLGSTSTGGGGGSGEFVMTGKIIDTVAGPPDLDSVPDAYALYIQGTTMEPRYYAGDLVFVHPHRPYREHNSVVVQIQVNGEDQPHGYILQFVGETPSTITLRQLNPTRKFQFQRSRVISVHRIVGSMER